MHLLILSGVLADTGQMVHLFFVRTAERALCMQTLEIRRHSMRKLGGGSQLSQEGVAYARRLGAAMGPFACVATSVVPRARETAIAMGFAVDYELVTLTFDAEV